MYLCVCVFTLPVLIRLFSDLVPYGNPHYRHSNSLHTYTCPWSINSIFPTVLSVTKTDVIIILNNSPICFYFFEASVTWNLANGNSVLEVIGLILHWDTVVTADLAAMLRKKESWDDPFDHMGCAAWYGLVILPISYWERRAIANAHDTIKSLNILYYANNSLWYATMI